MPCRSRAIVATVLMLGFAGNGLAEAAHADAQTARIDRIAGLARLWSTVAYFHPALAYRADIDLDRAVTAAIRDIDTADGKPGYEAALEKMLGAIGDPVTRILPPASPPAPAATNPASLQPAFHTTADGVLVVEMTHYSDLDDEKLETLKKVLPAAKAVVMDLRPFQAPSELERGSLSEALTEHDVPGLLTAAPLSIPGERSRIYEGYAPQGGVTDGGYFSGFLQQGRPAIASAPGARRIPVVFLVNADSDIPDVALGLQASGDGAIVLEGKTGDDPSARTQLVRLPDGITVQTRLGERIAADGTGEFIANVVIPLSNVTGEQNPAMQAALALAKAGRFATLSHPRLPSEAAPALDKDYADAPYPPKEYRVLAAFRLWAIIDSFYIYKPLIGEDWDAVLRQFIPRMEQAGNALEYNLAIAEMASHIHDSHVFVDSPVMKAFRGVAMVPFLARLIEGVPVITSITDADASGKAGLDIGDVIVSVDGKPAQDLIAEQLKYTSASTPQAGLASAERRFLRGADGSVAKVTVRNSDGQVREATVTRKIAYVPPSWGDRSGDIVRLLPGNIGYADLDRLTVPQVDAMFERFKNCSAIIFDDRGYPNGTAWPIAGRLTDRPDIVGALFKRRDALHPNLPDGEMERQDETDTMAQRLPHSDKWRYQGKTVMLIDARAGSQAEHTGLFLEAANGTKFIGSPTMGVNGDITYMTLPGGITVRFSGQGVWHADGRPLQRVGLQPDILVRPTLAGIRAHRDEVLEKALAYLTQSPTPDTARKH